MHSDQDLKLVDTTLSVARLTHVFFVSNFEEDQVPQCAVRCGAACMRVLHVHKSRDNRCLGVCMSIVHHTCLPCQVFGVLHVGNDVNTREAAGHNVAALQWTMCGLDARTRGPESEGQSSMVRARHLELDG